METQLCLCNMPIQSRDFSLLETRMILNRKNFQGIIHARRQSEIQHEAPPEQIETQSRLQIVKNFVVKKIHLHQFSLKFHQPG